VQVSAAARRPGRPRILLEAWYPGRTSLESLGRRLRRSLRVAGVPDGPRLRLRSVRDGRWVEAWQATLKPMPIGRRILALPEHLEPPRRTRRIVVRVPLGQAFGTGEHATTRLCLRLLEAKLKRGDRVADLGTGTGILAVAALRLGASRVVAVDADPIAVRVARDTLRRNQVDGAIDLRCADAAEACRRGPFDLALVNIGATALERLLPDIATALRPGGLAVLAGHLVDDEKGLCALARPRGLRLVARLRTRPWSALLLRRA